MSEARIIAEDKHNVWIRLTPWAYDKLTHLADKERRKYGPQAAFMLEAQLRDENQVEEAA